MKNEKLEELIDRIDEIRKKSKSFEEKYENLLQQAHPLYQKSAINLVHYLALRNSDIRDLQKELGYLGLSRLANSEAHVMTSLNSTKAILQKLNGVEKIKKKKGPVSNKKSRKLLNSNTKSILGNKSKGRRTRIMVTLPTEAAHKYGLVYRLIKNGMNMARINCAHDDPGIWKMIIDNIHSASSSLNKSCKIMMDLGGPKLRTGSMKPGPKVVHLSPEKDEMGKVTQPALVWLSPPKSLPPSESNAFIPVSTDWLTNVKKGDVIQFKDARGKKCKLEILRKQGKGRWALCSDSAYIATGTQFNLLKTIEENVDIVGELLPVEQRIIVQQGDLLVLQANKEPGEQAIKNKNGEIIQHSRISCTLPQVFKDVIPGEPILFDDGKIEGVIREVSDEELKIEITFAKEGGSKLRADKGINLPNSDLSVSGLTEKDLKDLPFIAENADAVDYSFVNNPDDVEEIQEILSQMNPDLGIVLKIETKKGFQNLPEILLTAMRSYPIGVMIARGDLAIECGWKHMAKIQQEIIRICEAAHIPDIWATQVLENLAKKGMPSRAEITDAATSQQAECVMLNKGPHIIDAIKMLDSILRSTEGYQEKRAPLLPELNISFSSD